MPNGEAAGLVYGGVPRTGLATVLGGITEKKPLDIFLEQKKERQKQEATKKAEGDKWLNDVLKYSPESWSPFTGQIQPRVENLIDQGARIIDMPEGIAKRQAKIDYTKEQIKTSADARKSFDIEETFKIVDANIDALKTKYPGLKIEQVRTEWRDYSLNPDRSAKNLDGINVIEMRNLDPYLNNADNWDMDYEFRDFVKGVPEMVNQLVFNKFGSLGVTKETIEYKSKFAKTDEKGEYILDEEGKPQINITPETILLFKQRKSAIPFLERELGKDSTLTEKDILEREMSLYTYAGKKVTEKLIKYTAKKGVKKVNVIPATGETYNVLNVEKKTGKVTTVPVEAIRVWSFKAIKATIPPRKMWSLSEDAIDKNVIGDYDVDILQVYKFWVNEKNEITFGKDGKLPTNTTGLREKKFAKIVINDTRKLKEHYLNQIKKLGGDPDFEKETDKPEIKKLRGRIEKLENEISEDITVERFIPYEQVKEKILSENTLGEIGTKPETEETDPLNIFD